MPSDVRAEIVQRLFDAYYERILCFAKRSVDAATAEDIAQDVFARLLKQPDLADKVITGSYLFKIAENLLKRRYRQRQRLEAFRAAKRRAERPETEDTAPARRREGAEILLETQQHLASLTEAEQDAVDLIICRGLSYREAARSLGVRVTSVNNWKFRGVQRLREYRDASDARRAPAVTTAARGRSASA